ncbi:MAG: hypothetical protein K2X39_05405, partial [Silvanigrellaceae bacterium]|nr:hypothetical protein [Silvanigrellaceae bacterium]
KLKHSSCVGTWSMLGSPMAAEVLASTGLDFVILDLEHGLFDFNDVVHSVRSIQVRNSQAIIRVSENSQPHILRALETSPNGILIPNISSYAEAKKAVSFCYYNPQGVRGLSPYTRVHAFHHENLETSINHTNENLMVGILVEGEQGIKEVPEILNIPGLDVIYFGIYDYSLALGYKGDIFNPEVQKSLKSMVENCNKKNIACGTFFRNIQDVRAYKEMGMKFIAYGSDGMVLKEGYNCLFKTDVS